MKFSTLLPRGRLFGLALVALLTVVAACGSDDPAGDRDANAKGTASKDHPLARFDASGALGRADGAGAMLQSNLFPVTTDVFLRAEATTKTMPDGEVIAMWGFALDSAFEALDGDVTVPGPTLDVAPGTPTLTIHLDNNLPVPISLVIPGQAPAAAMTPVRLPSDPQRVRSFTHETAPGNAAPVDYTWNLKPGTYLYQSGTQPQVQVQMGLYGGIQLNSAAGQAYIGAPSHNTEVTLLFSEIDPAFHAAVAADDFGPGQTVTSTIDYQPKYFLINGEPFDATAPLDSILPAGAANTTTLLRFANAGLRTVVPVIQGLYFSIAAEDGNLLPFAKEQYSLFLPAQKSADAYITPTTAGTYAIYDRRLDLTNGTAADGGMLVYLEVAP